MMSKFKYPLLLAVCIMVFSVGCNSRQTNVAIQEENKIQIALADSILLYFQQEQFDKIFNHFDDRMKLRLNKEQLAVIWAQLNTQAGKYSRGSFYKAEKMDNVGDRITYECYFGSQKLYFELVLGKDNIVAGLFFKP